jgi:hypothetical protein
VRGLSSEIHGYATPIIGLASSEAQSQGWSPEYFLGVHGTAIIVKQWQAGLLHDPVGQLHSEQRWRHTLPV